MAAASGSRLASFRRLYRWLNLTLVHQAVWPLLVLLAGAPAVRPPSAPGPWSAAAVAAPALAALLALLYLAQRPGGPALPSPVEPAAAGGRGSAGRDQARLLLLGLALALAAARLALGPLLPSGELLLYGLADVAAFQLIHFGVVARSFAAPDQGQAAAVLLFGLSWGLREFFLAGVGVGGPAPTLAFAAGFGIGVAIGLLSRLLRRWPGGFWSAAAGHYLVVYLVAGFAG